MATDSKPITREEVERFIDKCNEPPKLPREPLLLVHPRDYEAAKKFFGK